MIGTAACAPSFAGTLFSLAGRRRMKPRMDRRTEFQASKGGAELAHLLGAVARGDRRSFSALYDRTSAKVYGICLRLLGNEAEAQDVLQDVYVTVWQKADRYDAGRASAITWLAVLARNRAVDRLRRRSAAGEPIEAAAEVEDDSPSAFDILGQADDSARLGLCLEELEDRARAAIRGAFLEGATYPELAERQGVPLGTMKSWIRRGLQRLRGCLER
jgi:RNA polymerase sigma factor (sigma-70 family)